MTGLIILAAGASSRMGKPKQNLLFRGKTLLQQAIETGLASVCRPVIVVLGANAEAVKFSQFAYVKTLYNRDWNEGMASSIRCAINEIDNSPELDQAVIMLCDQPFVTAALIDLLIQRQAESGKPIIACSYKNTIGVPVLFKKSLFAELNLLQGPDGAKKLITAHPGDVDTVAFEQGGIDIDTIDDYEKLVQSGN